MQKPRKRWSIDCGGENTGGFEGTDIYEMLWEYFSTLTICTNNDGA